VATTREQDQLDAIAKLTAAIMLMNQSLLHLEGDDRKYVENAIEHAQEVLPELRGDRTGADDISPRLKKADLLPGRIREHN
jgi:hypothetical protein